jgi:predicted NAD/FAD-dependent oxidoreductase
MFFGHHVLAAEYTTDLLWQVDVKGRQTGETVKLEFDALVLSDKLLVLPNMYSVLADAQAGVLALPNTLTSTGAVVMLVALERAAACGALFPGAAESGVLSSSDYPQLDSRVIEKVVHDSAKPGRQAEGLDLWVVHSTAEYAAVHLRGEALDDEAAVLAEMRQAFLGPKGGDLDLAVAYASVMVSGSSIRKRDGKCSIRKRDGKCSIRKLDGKCSIRNRDGKCSIRKRDGK